MRLIQIATFTTPVLVVLPWLLDSEKRSYVLHLLIAKRDDLSGADDETWAALCWVRSSPSCEFSDRSRSILPLPWLLDSRGLEGSTGSFFRSIKLLQASGTGATFDRMDQAHRSLL